MRYFVIAETQELTFSLEYKSMSSDKHQGPVRLNPSMKALHPS